MMTLATEDVRRHFRSQVGSYDALMMRLIPFYTVQRDIVLSLLLDVPAHPRRVLDLGCGTGRMAEDILAACPLSVVTLLDLTPEMIDQARARIGEERAAYVVG